MKVGKNEAVELLQLAKEKDIPFANLLFVYVLEDLALRLITSVYKEHMWLGDDRFWQETFVKKESEEKITLYYKVDKEHLSTERPVPGQALTENLLMHFVAQVFESVNDREVTWKLASLREGKAYALELLASYKDMQVPVSLEIKGLTMDYQRPEKRSMTLWISGKTMEYYLYSTENQLGEDLVLLMDRLELIGDMGAYFRVYQIASTQSLSGRRLMEELVARTEKYPQIRKERRVEQIREYQSYGYMRKRWNQYVKRNGKGEISWEEALTKILALVEPVWMALCRQEVFFDDWMPEIGRFM